MVRLRSCCHNGAGDTELSGDALEDLQLADGHRQAGAFSMNKHNARCTAFCSNACCMLHAAGNAIDGIHSSPPCRAGDAAQQVAGLLRENIKLRRGHR